MTKVYVVLRDQKHENRGQVSDFETTVELVSQSYPEGLVFDEWEDYKPESYRYLKTRLRLVETELKE
ncbi:hypothetical protein KPE82_14045 [Acinetobacter baumannii]|uniref:hypothetical protein n=1 Tax=Acinetobacter baumannii TaxID=470 RepID=UPI0019139242|nr:hypothetical protein [Acinetobacter baumannii]MBK5979076.1 hypothetical protein [Acinetobacter baumannii]MBU3096729.1 hypothetical protein [Acinetobacter baumannii]MCZ3316049.1 hypothetical protein [Acinetobacter baumannii]MDC5043712.1 hypothetical protein [Acinetobacter baumannii]MDV7546426.1 hypothetical protein [Acinetobacter baumannii]